MQILCVHRILILDLGSEWFKTRHDLGCKILVSLFWFIDRETSLVKMIFLRGTICIQFCAHIFHFYIYYDFDACIPAITFTDYYYSHIIRSDVLIQICRHARILWGQASGSVNCQFPPDPILWHHNMTGRYHWKICEAKTSANARPKAW